MYSTLGRTAQKRWSCEKNTPHTGLSSHFIRVTSAGIPCLPRPLAHPMHSLSADLFRSGNNRENHKPDRRKPQKHRYRQTRQKVFCSLHSVFPSFQQQTKQYDTIATSTFFMKTPPYQRHTPCSYRALTVLLPCSYRALTVLLLRKETGATRKHSAAVR